MAKWAYAEDYTVCRFYLNHVNTWNADKAIVMESLKYAGFPERNWSSVRMRIGNFIYVHTQGESGLSGVAEQSKRVYKGLIGKYERNSLYETLQGFMVENYTPPLEFTSLNTKADLLAFSAAERTALDRIIDETSKRKSFGEALTSYIDKHGLDDVEVYKTSNVERDTFWRIKNDKNKSISRKTILRLCIGLRMPYETAVKFLASAGLAFDRHSQTEMIIVWFLQHEIYDTCEIDATLYEYDLETLFSEE